LNYPIGIFKYPIGILEYPTGIIGISHGHNLDMPVAYGRLKGNPKDSYM
jgi:hypothetical protein